MLFANNPMSAVCSAVCNHMGQCEGACIQGKKGTPIHFSSIEHYISTTYLERREFAPAPSCGKRVAVIGSGPAGITVAIKLAQAGCAVTVFEQRAEIGGVLEYGIPDFRLPRTLVQRYRKVMCDLGVRVRPSTTIGGALRIDDLLRDGYDAVFVGTGTWCAQTGHSGRDPRQRVLWHRLSGGSVKCGDWAERRGHWRRQRCHGRGARRASPGRSQRHHLCSLQACLR